jgi:hypothetical protein
MVEKYKLRQRYSCNVMLLMSGFIDIHDSVRERYGRRHCAAAYCIHLQRQVGFGVKLSYWTGGTVCSFGKLKVVE